MLQGSTSTRYNPSSQVLYDALNVMCCCSTLGVTQAQASLAINSKVCSSFLWCPLGGELAAFDMLSRVAGCSTLQLRSKFEDGRFAREWLLTLDPNPRTPQFLLLLFIAVVLGAINVYMYVDRNYWRKGLNAWDEVSAFVADVWAHL